METFITIADEINKEISEILLNTLSRAEHKYRTNDGYIRWGKVEKDIHLVVYKKMAEGIKNMVKRKRKI